MNRIGAILITVAVVGALLAVPLGVSAAAAEHTESTGANSSLAPGERLAGAVGVQQATVDGDLSERTYEVQLRNAESDEQRADIVAERRDEIEQRLDDHRTELAELRAARDAGNISEGTYRARVATVAAEKASTERSAMQAGATARQLPDAALAERGISVDSFDELRTNARELGGEETAEIAREIGGKNVRGGAGDRTAGAPDNRPSGAKTVGENTAGDKSAGDKTAGDNRPTDDASGTNKEAVTAGNPNGNQAATDTKAETTDQSSNSERDVDRDTQQNGADRDTDNRNNSGQSP